MGSKLSFSRSSKNMARPTSPLRRRISRRPIAPMTSINWECHEPIRLTILWAAQPASTSGMLAGQRSARSQPPQRRHSRAAIQARSTAAASAPQMMILATCSARAIPPEAIRDSFSRNPSATRARWTWRTKSVMKSRAARSMPRPLSSAARVITPAPALARLTARPGAVWSRGSRPRRPGRDGFGPVRRSDPRSGRSGAIR